MKKHRIKYTLYILVVVLFLGAVRNSWTRNPFPPLTQNISSQMQKMHGKL